MSREAFEHWYADHTGDAHIRKYCDSTGRYQFNAMQSSWEAWQAAQTQSGDGEAPVAWLKPAHELVENSAPDVVTAELRGATVARGGIAASCMENYSVPLYKKQPAVNQQLPEGHTAVKTETLQWLLGEAGGFECPKDEYFNGIQPKFWWRRHLRAAIAAAQEQGK